MLWIEDARTLRIHDFTATSEIAVKASILADTRRSVTVGKVDRMSTSQLSSLQCLD
jgi:hypothetical protein